MEKSFKISLKLLASIGICYYLFLLGFVSKYNRPSWGRGKYEQFAFVFANPEKDDISKKTIFSHVHRNYTLSTYYFGKGIVKVWSFDELNNVNPHNVKINDKEPYFFEFDNNVTLNVESDPICIKSGFSFNKSLVVGIDKESRILKNIETPLCKGFYGEINQISLANSNEENQIVLKRKNDEKRPMIFLMYKAQGRFLFISIYNFRNITFDENWINILKLR